MTLLSTLTLFLAVVSTATAHRFGSSKTRKQQQCEREPCVYFKDVNPTVLETDFRCTSAEDCKFQCLYDGTSFVCEEDLFDTNIDVCSLQCVTNGREECWDNKMCIPLSSIFPQEVVAGGCMGPEDCGGGECRYNLTAKTLLCDTSAACTSPEGLNTCCEFPCVEMDSPEIPIFKDVPAVIFKDVPPVEVCDSYKMCYPISTIPDNVDRTACAGPDDCVGECRYNTDANALQCDDGLLLCDYFCVEPDGGFIPV